MRWPLESFTVHLFRGLQGLELAGLGQINLLVGSNDSGKTSVLEALALYSRPQDPLCWISTAKRRDPAGPPDVRVEQVRWLFPQHADEDVRRPYQGSLHLSATGNFPIRTVYAHFRELRGTRSAGAASVLVELERARGAKIHVELTLEQAEASPSEKHRHFTFWDGERVTTDVQPEPPFLSAEVVTPYDHWFNVGPARNVSHALLGRFRNEVLELLRAFDPRIKDLEVLAPEGDALIYLDDADAGLLPLSAYGDGIRRVLRIASVLPLISGGVLLIDELETAIHVSALGKVFRWVVDACKKYQVQLFATTHSLEAIDAILAADTTPEEDIIAYRLERTEGGGTLAKRYGEDLLKRLRYERGLDVR